VPVDVVAGELEGKELWVVVVRERAMEWRMLKVDARWRQR